MCGIVGILDHRKKIDKFLLAAMSDSLKYRGPDDSGIWINEEKNMGMGHRRLSIIDLSRAGRQPMTDYSKKICITYNGEIYNFKEIKKELIGKGYKFISKTDTEVIINAYKEWGIKCLKKFNGMFSFGIYDDKNKKIFIARDRVGKKPLYYAQYNEKFIFSSELKSILCDSEFPLDIDYRALNFYLTFGYISFDFTIFKFARKLPPAHMMIYDINSRKIEIARYWDVPEPDDRKYKEEELLEELEYLLKDAVRLRLISDVPVGAFLSGGLDSSLIVSMMANIADKEVKTFSVGFKNKKYNELPYAKIVADYFGTTHTEFIVEPDKFNIIDDLAKHIDEPFADSSMIPTYYVSKMTGDYVKVALSGDGGDELFGGYSSYIATLGNYYKNKFLPQYLRKLISKCSENLPDKIIGKRELIRLKYDFYGAFIDRISHRYFKDVYRKKLLNGETLGILSDKYNEPEEIINNILSTSKRDLLNTLEYTDFINYLPGDILTKVDRMGMKVSLEVRCPFLDYRIVEFAFKKVRGKYKIKGKASKYLLKKLGKKILPSNLDVNRKWGFAVPLSDWFRNDLKVYVHDKLLSRGSIFFDKAYISNLLDEHMAGIEHSARIFTLLIFFLWHEKIYRK